MQCRFILRFSSPGCHYRHHTQSDTSIPRWIDRNQSKAFATFLITKKNFAIAGAIPNLQIPIFSFSHQRHVVVVLPFPPYRFESCQAPSISYIPFTYPSPASHRYRKGTAHIYLRFFCTMQSKYQRSSRDRSNAPLPSCSAHLFCHSCPLHQSHWHYDPT